MDPKYEDICVLYGLVKTLLQSYFFIIRWKSICSMILWKSNNDHRDEDYEWVLITWTFTHHTYVTNYEQWMANMEPNHPEVASLMEQ